MSMYRAPFNENVVLHLSFDARDKIVLLLDLYNFFKINIRIDAIRRFDAASIILNNNKVVFRKSRDSYH